MFGAVVGLMVLKVIMNYLSITRIILLPKAAGIWLDLDNYSSRQHFFDYDLDGDLDMFIESALYSDHLLEMQMLEIKEATNVEINYSK
jgi:hypothetical protein